jgi:hypothetical protein
LLQQPQVIALYQTLVDEANEQLPRWSKVQQFQLLNAPLTVANGLLDASSQVNRAKVNEVFAREIEALYEFGVRSSEFGVRPKGLAPLSSASSSEFGVRPKGFLKDTASHIAPLRSTSSFEFKGLVKKLNLAKFKGLLGDWRHQSRSLKSSELGVSSSELNPTPKKLNLEKFKGLLSDWRHQTKSSNLDISFVGGEDNLSTPNSFQIPFVEREDDLLTPNSELRIPNSFKGETI